MFCLREKTTAIPFAGEYIKLVSKASLVGKSLVLGKWFVDGGIAKLFSECTLDIGGSVEKQPP